jgi:hypothetical protein
VAGAELGEDQLDGRSPGSPAVVHAVNRNRVLL